MASSSASSRAREAREAASALLNHVEDALTAPMDGTDRSTAAREAALALLSCAAAKPDNEPSSNDRHAEAALALAAAERLLGKVASVSAVASEEEDVPADDAEAQSSGGGSTADVLAELPMPATLQSQFSGSAAIPSPPTTTEITPPPPPPPALPTGSLDGGRSAAILETARSLLQIAAVEDDIGTEDEDDLDELRAEIEANDLEVGQRMLHAARLSDRLPSTQMLTSHRAASDIALMRQSCASAARRSSAAAPPAKRSRLQALCIELVATERRYHRDLTLLVHTFVRGLRSVAPALIPELVPNCDQLLELHGGLCERMSAAAARLSDEALASALGSELLRVSPFFTMYVSYCAHFMRANELLEQAHRHLPILSRTIADAEEQIQRRNIVERGENSPVSLFAFLIKPVQRLCQFPLLFKEITRAMAPPTPRRYEPPAPGAARDATFCPRVGLEKAEYVLAVLEDVAQSVNERVRLRESELRLLDELDATALPRLADGPGSAASEIAGPASKLIRELRLAIDFHTLDAPTMERIAKVRARSGSGGGRPRSSTASSKKRTSTMGASVLANIADGIGGLARGSRASEARPPPSAARRHADEGGGLSKLYIFADSIIFAEPTHLPVGCAFEAMARWPLHEVRVTPPRGMEPPTRPELPEAAGAPPAAAAGASPPAAAAGAATDGAGGDGALARLAFAEDSGFGGLELRCGDEMMMCACEPAEARDVMRLIGELQRELSALCNRRGRGAEASSEPPAATALTAEASPAMGSGRLDPTGIKLPARGQATAGGGAKLLSPRIMAASWSRVLRARATRAHSEA